MVLAAQPSTLDKIRRIPADTWVNLAIGIVSVFVVIRAWRTLKRLNDYAPYIAMAVMASGVFFYWVYSRTEPAFLTPIVERLTPFFPTQAKQQDTIEQVRHSRDNQAF